MTRWVRRLIGDPMLVFPGKTWQERAAYWLYTHLDRPLARWTVWGLRWRLKQRLAGKGRRYYGDGGTVHRTGEIDVETRGGEVVAVWFRCQPLAWRQCEVDDDRAEDMKRMGHGAHLSGVEVVESWQ